MISTKLTSLLKTKAFIRICTILIVSALALTATARPTAAQTPVTIRVYTQLNELSKDEIASFEKANPDIKIDFTDMSAMASFNQDLAISSGDLPDVMRVGPTTASEMVQSGNALDLTDYFKSSKIVKLDDIAAAANYYKFNDRYYGFPKDWSPDSSLFIDRAAFQSAGIPIPSTSDPLTYAELAQIARKLAVKENGKMTRYGLFVPSFLYNITTILIQRNSSLFNKDYSELQLTRNPVALEAVKYFYDLGIDGTLNPDSELVERFWSDKLPTAIVQFGYWYGGSVKPDNPNYANLMMLPAPTWDRSLPRVDATFGPTGLMISAKTKYPEQAYRFLEWYTVGEAGKVRAAHGWGAPPLKSMFDLLPRTTPLDKQRYDVLVSEMAYSDWKYPVYPHKSIEDTFNKSWQTNIKLAMQGKLDFNNFASNIEQDVNLAILNEQVGKK